MTGLQRTAGYCVLCNRIVERGSDGACPTGHPHQAVRGRIALGEGEIVPSLPRFNWAAFALPPVWGAAHGQWAGLFFLPIWLFADSSVANAGFNAVTLAVAVVVVLVTFAFQTQYARRAYGMAFSRVADRMSVGEFVARQRLWAYFCVPVGISLLTLAVAYRVST